jgi:hypothetical protein
LYCE